MNYTEEQISVAFNKLPRGVQDIVFTPEIDKKVQKLGVDAGLLIDQLSTLNNLVNFAIMNLIPRDSFSSIIKEELSVTNEVAEKLTDAISREIFAPIEAMEAQAKKESVIYESEDNILETKEDEEKEPVTTTQVSLKVNEKMPDVAPENLPTEEGGESFLPPIPSKFGAVGEEIPAHPFEEKMRKVFTAGQQSLGDLAIEPRLPGAPAPTSVVPLVPHVPNVPPTPPIYQADPYREAIE